MGGGGGEVAAVSHADNHIGDGGGSSRMQKEACRAGAELGGVPGTHGTPKILKNLHSI